MTVHPFDVGAGMRYSTLDPNNVREILACWRKDDMFGYDYSVGFVARLPDDYPLGKFAYIVLTVEGSINREGVSTQYFDTPPDHLYARAVGWITEGPILAEINKSLGYSKAVAKHGEFASSYSQT